ncbi:ubiquitin-protein ligase [Lithospermum erythrorhizon]|uniref:SKP1-like protein n=1 Tax=Lithospermum erythrorhizon TaxID=34254 RepID=A0AAV3R7W7_LITER
MTSKNEITITSSTGFAFDLEKDIASMSVIIRDVIEAGKLTVVPLENVTTEILAKVVNYMKKHHVSSNATEEELKMFDCTFVEVDPRTLLELIKAASYMDIPALQELASKAMANLIKDLSVPEVREIFNIKSDYTEEEEDAIQAATKRVV